VGDDGEIAYQVVGDGPIDLVYFHGMGQIDLRWDDPHAAEFRRALASFTRLILFDRRGTGASDRGSGDAVSTWEEWADDLRWVLDAVDSGSAVVFAEADAGPVGVLFAAMHPERTRGLILANTTARFARDADYEIGLTAEAIDATVQFIRRAWGTAEMARAVSPATAHDQEFVAAFARMQRAAATPRAAAAQYCYMMEHIDVRSILHLV